MRPEELAMSAFVGADPVMGAITVVPNALRGSAAGSLRTRVRKSFQNQSSNKSKLMFGVCGLENWEPLLSLHIINSGFRAWEAGVLSDGR